MANIIQKYILQPLAKSMVRSMSQSDFMQIWQNFGGSTGSFFNNDIPFNQVSGNTTGSIIGVRDLRVNPFTLARVVKDPTIAGMIGNVRDQLFKNGYRFSGKSEATNKALKKHLESLDFEKIKVEILNCLIGAAGGNGLLRLKKTRQGLKARVEPFMAEGRYRVSVYADYDNREVISYDILNPTQTRIENLTPDQVYKISYPSPDNDFRFGTGPAILAAQVWHLKYLLLATNETIANGLQSNKILSVDWSAVDFGNPTTASEIIAYFTGEFEKFQDIMKSEVSGLANRNTTIATSVPLKEISLTMPNVEMQTLPFIIECDKQAAAAYRVALSTLGRTESANYSTSEQNVENLSELNVDALKRVYKNIVEDWIMPNTMLNYDKEKYPFDFGIDPSQEDLKVRQQNLATYQIWASNPLLADIDESILISIGLKPKALQTDLNANSQEQATQTTIDDSQEPQRQLKEGKNETDPNKLLSSKIVLQAKAKLKKALEKQIENA